MFAVELQGNPSTGYLWSLEVDKGEATLLRKDTVVPDTMTVGGSVTERFLLVAEDTGIIELHAEHKRPWESGIVPPASRRFFKVDVD